MRSILITLSLPLMLAAACSSNQSATATSATTDSVAVANKLTFNADSAMAYISEQVKFGPRVPGTVSHEECAKWLTSKLVATNPDTIITQKATVTAYTDAKLPITNIMAMYNKDAKERVLLAAHYDTRPWADNETDATKRATPIAGANDGASGVAVLLEIARQIGMNRPEIGVDILLVDAEDYGDSSGFGLSEETWCLGTQYWAQHTPYTAANRPRYGIVLDMVGGANARFHREYYSEKSAHAVVDKVWGEANRLGLASSFINEVGGSIIDDHIFINRAGIPCIDIVECNNVVTGSFPSSWHTHHDDMACIDAAPLKAVGQTVLNVICKEKP